MIALEGHSDRPKIESSETYLYSNYYSAEEFYKEFYKESSVKRSQITRIKLGLKNHDSSNF